MELLEEKCTQGDHEKLVAELEEAYQLILQISTIGFVTDEMKEIIQTIGKKRYIDEQGVEQEYLTDEEVESLSVRKGSLTDAERAVMESHALMTTRILETMYFGKRFEKVLLFAGAHHEKLSGKGYPHGLKGNEIPMEVRILSVLDIFEALTTNERPYKEAFSVGKAFQILYQMAESGELDSNNTYRTITQNSRCAV